MSRVERDPHHLGEEAWKYGGIRDIKLHAIVHGDILWGYEFQDADGVHQHRGAFPGPFEALAAVLQRIEEETKQRELSNKLGLYRIES